MQYQELNLSRGKREPSSLLLAQARTQCSYNLLYRRLQSKIKLIISDIFVCTTHRHTHPCCLFTPFTHSKLFTMAFIIMVRRIYYLNFTFSFVGCSTLTSAAAVTRTIQTKAIFQKKYSPWKMWRWPIVEIGAFQIFMCVCCGIYCLDDGQETRNNVIFPFQCNNTNGAE